VELPPDDRADGDDESGDDDGQQNGRLLLVLDRTPPYGLGLVPGDPLAQGVEQRPWIETEQLAVEFQIPFDEYRRADRVEALVLERGEKPRLDAQELRSLLERDAALLAGGAQGLADPGRGGRRLLGVLRRCETVIVHWLRAARAPRSRVREGTLRAADVRSGRRPRDRRAPSRYRSTSATPTAWPAEPRASAARTRAPANSSALDTRDRASRRARPETPGCGRAHRGSTSRRSR